MKGNREDRDFAPGRPIKPEDPICRWRFLFSVCLKDLLPVGASQTEVLVSLQAFVSGIFGQQPYGLLDSPVTFLLGCITLETIVGRPCFVSPFQLKQQARP